MNRINEIGDTPKGQKALGAVFARAHNRKHRADKCIAEPHRQAAKDHWDGVKHDAMTTASKYTKDKSKFADGAQEYYKSHQYKRETFESNNTRNMNKKLIRLTEQDLHRIVKESVNRIIKEGAHKASMEEIDRNLVNKAIGAFVQFYGERPTLQDYNINDDGRVHLTLKSKHCFQAMYFDTKGNRQTDFREVDWDPYSWKKETMQQPNQL